ncbi:HIT-like protein [Artomyces pyxidatus]|uniref:HIT-like protein n=1 Tax=Artomyces pyxidatus TaxID=48021 RepID=A0ACB8T0X9_9AGAM|nr:HIT-like protein [Artomyces pyxidatus]
MTSFIIKAHERRPVPEFWRSDKGCAFCQIILRAAPAYRIYEDDLVVAFLDILPLRPGHTLIVPKAHHSRVSELPENYAAALGVAISKVSLALTKAMDNTALNVVCNQEYAQAVAHVHYHVIPAPKFGSMSTSMGSSDLHAAPVPKELHNREFEVQRIYEDAARLVNVLASSKKQ